MRLLAMIDKKDKWQKALLNFNFPTFRLASTVCIWNRFIDINHFPKRPLGE